MDDQDRERTWELLGLLFQAHPWHGVAIGPEAPRVVTAYIEIVPTDTVKYEIDKPSGHLKVDRPQQFSNVCPTLYGFIPQTFCGARVAAFGAAQDGTGLPTALEGDADPLDICVLSERGFSHGDVLLQAVPVGGLRLIDRNQADDKIVAVLKGDAAFGHCAGDRRSPRGADRAAQALLPHLQAAARSRAARPVADHQRLRRRRGPRGDRAQPRGLRGALSAAQGAVPGGAAAGVGTRRGESRRLRRIASLAPRGSRRTLAPISPDAGLAAEVSLWQSAHSVVTRARIARRPGCARIRRALASRRFMMIARPEEKERVLYEFDAFRVDPVRRLLLRDDEPVRDHAQGLLDPPRPARAGRARWWRSRT